MTNRLILKLLTAFGAVFLVAAAPHESAAQGIPSARAADSMAEFCRKGQAEYPGPRRPPKVPHLWPPKLLHPGHGDLTH